MAAIEEMTDAVLDAAVAVEVMGWERDPRDDGWRDRNFVLVRDPWHPSTDYAAAFEVVGRMMRHLPAVWLQFVFRLPRVDDPTIDRQWTPILAAVSETLRALTPRAICEAALQAVRSGT